MTSAPVQPPYIAFVKPQAISELTSVQIHRDLENGDSTLMSLAPSTVTAGVVTVAKSPSDPGYNNYYPLGVEPLSIFYENLYTYNLKLYNDDNSYWHFAIRPSTTIEYFYSKHPTPKTGPKAVVSLQFANGKSTILLPSTNIGHAPMVWMSLIPTFAVEHEMSKFDYWTEQAFLSANKKFTKKFTVETHKFLESSSSVPPTLKSLTVQDKISSAIADGATVIAVSGKTDKSYYLFRDKWDGNDCIEVEALIGNRMIKASYQNMEDASAVVNHLLKQKSAQKLAGDLGTAVDSLLSKKDYPNLKLKPIPFEFGGMHEKTALVDRFSRKWMAKYYSNDPSAEYRVEAEHYANIIGRMFGFRTPETFAGYVEKRYSIVQRIEANDGDMHGVAIEELSDTQLCNAMQEHVLDWMISNHDTNPSHLLRAPDKETIIGIDLGQAFKHLHDDALAVGYLPQENPEPVWYDQVYCAISAGILSQEQAEGVARAVLSKAVYVQEYFDAEYEKAVTRALAHRENYPSKYPDRDSFVAALMERKRSLYTSFETLYKQLFAAAGYDWTLDVGDLPSRVGDAYVNVSPEFVDSIKTAGPFGRSLMFHSADIEDYHAVLTQVEHKEGTKGLLWHLKLRSDADSRVTGYIQSLFTGEPTNKITYGLPRVKKFHDVLVAYLKTVAQHAPKGGKTPDGEYNTETGSAAYVERSDVLSKILSLKTAREEGQLSHKLGSLSTLEQQDVLISALEAQLETYDKIVEAQTLGVPVASLYPDLKLEVPTYTPSNGLTHHKDSYPAEQHLLADYGYAVKTSDGGHYRTDMLGGNRKWISAEEYVSIANNPDSTWVPLFGRDPAYWQGPDGTKYTQMTNGFWVETACDFNRLKSVNYILSHQELVNYISDQPAGEWHFYSSEESEESVIDVHSKHFTIEHTSAMGLPYRLDAAKKAMVEVPVSSVNTNLHQGMEYLITYNNVEIRYRAYHEGGATLSQQGLMSVVVHNWDGSQAAIEDVLDTLDTFGVDVSPANEATLELDYWTHLSNIILDRCDHNKDYQSKLLDALNRFSDALDSGLEFERLEFWRTAWSEALDGNIIPDSWRPKFSTLLGFENSGHPYWLRPDTTIDQLKKIYSEILPNHYGEGRGSDDDDDYCCDDPDCDCGGSSSSQESASVTREQDAMRRLASILSIGSLLSTEERLRILNLPGPAAEGMSSQGDQPKGSSDFVFLRQRSDVSVPSCNWTFALIASPEPSLRINSYAYSDDLWGDTAVRKSYADWTAKRMYGKSRNCGNELMVKKEVPVLAAIVYADTTRENVLKELASMGATTNVPIYTASEWSSVIEGDLWP